MLPTSPASSRAGLRSGEVWTLWTEAFDEFRAELSMNTCRVSGCLHRTERRQGSSGMVIDTHQFDVYEVREGQVVRGTLGYRSKAEALEAAALSGVAGLDERRQSELDSHRRGLANVVANRCP